MSEDKTLLEEVNDTIVILEKIKEEFSDEDVDSVIDIIMRLIAKPDVPASTAAPLVVKTQALSSKLNALAKVYMLWPLDIEKDEKSRKKNTLLTLASEMEKISNALKYLVRS